MIDIKLNDFLIDEHEKKIFEIRFENKFAIIIKLKWDIVVGTWYI